MTIRTATMQDLAVLAAIEARFPGTVENGALQRKKLGAIVFSDPQALQDLNRITHGAVKAEVQRRLTPLPQLAAIDAIGLFESGLDKLCQCTVAVDAPRDARIARLMARDGISADYAAARIDAQPSSAVFAQRCDTVLVNDTTQENFQEKCLAFLHKAGV